MPTIHVLMAAIAVACGVAFLAKTLRKPGFRWLQGQATRHMALVDRVPLTHQHSIHLLTVRGRWMAIAVTPQGCQLLESGTEQETYLAKGHSA